MADLVERERLIHKWKERKSVSLTDPVAIDDWGMVHLKPYSWGLGIAVCTPGEHQLEFLVNREGIIGSRDAHSDLRLPGYELNEKTGHRLRPNYRADLAELKKTREFEGIHEDLKYLLAA
jgi:hypothetical protein